MSNAEKLNGVGIPRRELTENYLIIKANSINFGVTVYFSLVFCNLDKTLTENIFSYFLTTKANQINIAQLIKNEDG